MKPSSLSRFQLLEYGLLAVPIAFAGFPLYVLAPDFYATHHNVSLSMLGIILLGLRAFDALQDPVIGLLSDRFANKVYGCILLCALVLVVSIYALFHPAASYPVLWFTACMAIAVTCYSILGINLNTLGALWTGDKNEQTRISSTREALGLIGLLIAVILPGALGKYLAFDYVYAWFSIILGVIMCIALVSFSHWFSGRDNKTAHMNNSQKSLRQTLLSLPQKTYHLFLVYGLSVLASSIPAILVIFFIRDRLNSESFTGLFLLLYFLSGALVMPLWKKLSVRYGKQQIWLCTMLLSVASFIWAFFLGAGDVWQYALICILSGAALGGDLALPPSMLADQIHQTASQNSAATQFSILTLLTKAGLAIGSVIVLPLLDVVAFTPAAHNSETPLFTLSAAYALIPCIIKLASAYLLYHLFIYHKGTRHVSSLENHITRGSHHA